MNEHITDKKKNKEKSVMFFLVTSSIMRELGLMEDHSINTLHHLFLPLSLVFFFLYFPLIDSTNESPITRNQLVI